MVRSLLVPLDGSSKAESVLAYGGVIASCTGVRLHLLLVISPASHLMGYRLEEGARRLRQAGGHSVNRLLELVDNIGSIAHALAQRCRITCLVVPPPGLSCS